MRDEQVRRYARHILLPDFGGLGQTALMVSAAILDMRDPAAPIAARYLAAGGVGTVVLREATEAQAAVLANAGADTRIVLAQRPADIPDHARIVPLPGAPAWWNPVDGDDVALAFWRGSLAAAQWMAATANR
jgi:molybdopterin-synthase adenylyltransferase